MIKYPDTMMQIKCQSKNS